MGVPPDNVSRPSSSRPSSPVPLEGEDGYSYTLQRIGTEVEKQSVEKELAELRERLSQVEEWKKRRQEIEEELDSVLTSKGEIVPPPPYQQGEA